jgi:GNAT superfamily N-acetyltransferase
VTAVRIAAPADENRLFAFVWNAYEETPHAPKSESRVRDVVRAAVNRESMDFNGTVLMPPIFGLIDGSAGIEAAVGLYPEQWWYSDSYALKGFFFFVHPDYRRGTSSHTKALREFAIKFAADAAVPLLETSYGAPDAPKHRIYAKHMTPIGIIYGIGLDLAA